VHDDEHAGEQPNVEVWISQRGDETDRERLRAAQAELGPDAPPPRTVAAQYLEAPAAGPAEVAVEVLRRGKRVAVAETRMHQNGRLVCQATIVFSAARGQPLELHRSAPTAPAPDELAELDAGTIPLAPPVFRQLRLLPTHGAVPFSGVGEASTGGWMALRDDEHRLDPARLVAMSDLWWPAIFPILRHPVVVPTIQLTVYLRTVGHTVTAPVFAQFRTETVAEGHLEEVGELWSAEGELLAESRQLALMMELSG